MELSCQLGSSSGYGKTILADELSDCGEQMFSQYMKCCEDLTACIKAKAMCTVVSDHTDRESPVPEVLLAGHETIDSNHTVTMPMLPAAVHHYRLLRWKRLPVLVQRPK